MRLNSFRKGYLNNKIKIFKRRSSKSALLNFHQRLSPKRAINRTLFRFWKFWTPFPISESIYHFTQTYIRKNSEQEEKGTQRRGKSGDKRQLIWGSYSAKQSFCLNRRKLIFRSKCSEWLQKQSFSMCWCLQKRASRKIDWWIL